MASLANLPAEIISSILRHLDTTDYFAVRQTCRHLESASLSNFAERCFRKKGYLITSPSLNVLAQSSKHSGIQRYVQHVWFNPDLFTFTTPACAPDPDWPYPMIDTERSELDVQRYETYQDCVHDHKNLLMSSKLKDVLTEAFTSLPNLEVVGMRRSEDHQPWGWARLKAAVGEDPRVLGPIPSGPMSSLSGPTYLFMAIVNAAATTNLKLKRLYTDAIEIDNILPSILSQETYRAALSSLLYLEINASKAWLTQKAKNSRSLEASQFGEGLVSLLKATPQLLELGLQIFRDLRQSYYVAQPTPRNRDNWRQSYPYLSFQKLAAEVRLQNLTRIKLEKLITSAETLQHFLTPSKHNLQSLKVRSIRLISSDEVKRPWEPIFTFLLTSCPRLSYLLLHQLMHESGGISFVKDSGRRGGDLPDFDRGDFPIAQNTLGDGTEFFTEYDHISLEAVNRDEVVSRLERIVEEHWYERPMYSYLMDEGVWHTDTSDEEM